MTNKNRNNQWKKVKLINSLKTQNKYRKKNKNKNKKSYNYQNILEENVSNAIS